MPPERTQARNRPRQDPVSCQLCRSKKLKCDRQLPCANCRSRKVECEYHGDRPLGHHSSLEDELRAENRAIRARLQKLEESVFGSPHPLATSLPTHSSNSTVSTPLQPKVENDNVVNDLNYLENIGFSSNDALSQFSDRIEVNILSIEDTAELNTQLPFLSVLNFIPEELALHIIDVYEEHLEPLQHVMHLDTVRSQIKQLYASLANGQDVELGVAALTLTIAASVSFYYPFYEHGEKTWTQVFESAQVSNKVFTVWLKQALDVIGHIKSNARVSLEAIQASILLTFLFYHVEGFSARTRMLHTGAIMMARELGLHCIDAPQSRAARFAAGSIVDAETARKVWWHLAATDWFLAFAGGSHAGTYSIQLRQMMVNKPYNLHPADLATADPRYARDPSRPTVMSYFLQRVKLSEICREAVDTLWEIFYTSDVTDIAYEKVVALDAKFAASFEELPRFMKMETTVEMLKAEYGAAYHTTILQQRAMSHLMMHTRRCKLHLPFLIRAKKDPRFSFSRQKCLQSAHAVFDIRRISWDERTMRQRAKIGGVLHHFYYAAMVLVLDLCVNSRTDKSSLTNVWDALALLEDAKGTSPVADEFVTSLTSVLRKNRVELPIRDERPAGNGLQIPISTNADASTRGNSSMDGTIYTATQTATLDTVMPNDDLWQDFVDYGQQFDTDNWDAILNDLEMRMM